MWERVATDERFVSLTPLDPVAARRAAERAAPHYVEHAVAQREVEDRLLDRLDHFRPEVRLGLDLGCGPGRALGLLRKRFPESSWVGLDWARGMLETGTAGPGAVLADLRQLPLAPRRFDLVFSNLALPWVNDLQAAFAEIRRVMRPGGLFLFSTLGMDSLRELRTAWHGLDDTIRVHRFADMHDLGDLLVAGGFRDPVMDREDLVLTYPDVASLLRELRATGSQNVARDRRPGLTGKGRMEAMMQTYGALAVDGRVPLSLELVFGAALAPDEGQPIRTQAGDVAHFSVESLKSQKTS